MNLILKNNNDIVFQNDTVKNVSYNQLGHGSKPLIMVTVDYISTSDYLQLMGRTFALEVKNGSVSVEKYDVVEFYKNKTTQNGNNIETMLIFEIQ